MALSLAVLGALVGTYLPRAHGITGTYMVHMDEMETIGSAMKADCMDSSIPIGYLHGSNLTISHKGEEHHEEEEGHGGHDNHSVFSELFSELFSEDDDHDGDHDGDHDEHEEHEEIQVHPSACADVEWEEVEGASSETFKKKCGEVEMTLFEEPHGEDDDDHEGHKSLLEEDDHGHGEHGEEGAHVILTTIDRNFKNSGGVGGCKYVFEMIGDHDDHEDEESGADNHLGLALLANIIIMLCTLTGVFLLTPCFRGAKGENMRAFEILAGAFSSGTLLGASSYLILPEALSLIGEGGRTEGARNLIWGSWLLTGFFIGAMVHLILPVLLIGEDNGNHVKQVESIEMEPKGIDVKRDPENGDSNGHVNGNGAVMIEQGPKGSFCNPREWKPVVWNVLLGDGLHNIADGVAVAVAFKLCDPSVGWVVATGAIAHELSTELGDYLVLTTKGNMTPPAALFFNLLSGITCVIGGLIASGVDMASSTTGGILAFSAGMYMWVVVEVFQSAMKASTMKQVLGVLGMLFFGFLVVSLVLLGHEHCEAGHDH